MSARNGAWLARGVRLVATQVGYRLGEAAATTLRIARMTTAALSYELTAAAARLTWTRKGDGGLFTVDNSTALPLDWSKHGPPVALSE